MMMMMLLFVSDFFYKNDGHDDGVDECDDDEK